MARDPEVVGCRRIAVGDLDGWPGPPACAGTGGRDIVGSRRFGAGVVDGVGWFGALG